MSAFKRKKSTLFFVILVIALAIFGYIVLHQKWFWRFELTGVRTKSSIQVYQELPPGLKSLFLGDSGAQQGIVPRQLGRNVYNLSVSGASPRLLGELIARYNVANAKCIFLQTLYSENISYGDSYYKLRAYFDLHSSAEFIADLRYAKAHGFFPYSKNGLWGSVAYFYMNKLKLVGMPQETLVRIALHPIVMNYLLDTERIVQDRGYFRTYQWWNRGIDLRQIDRFQAWNDAFVSHAQYDLELNDLYKKVNVISKRVIYIEIPILNDTKYGLINNKYFDSKYAHICQDVFGSTVECYRPQQVYDESDFTDPGHLESKGAEKYTREIRDAFPECFE